METLTEKRPFGVSALFIKIFAALTMVCDHVGASLFPEIGTLRIIGRIAFPLFAYFIAEGCRYTRNKKKRFFLVFGLALACEAAYLVLTGKLTGTALLTFSCSIPIIYALQAIKRALAAKDASRGLLLPCVALCAAVGAAILVGNLVPIDYGLPGVFLPVLISLCDYREGEAPAVFRYLDNRPVRLAVFALGILAVWYFRGMMDVQFYGLLALIPMAFYNGTPGRTAPRFKYWFYIFYPAHLIIIWILDLLI